MEDGKKFLSRLCRMILLGPRFSANNLTELKFGKGSWSGHGSELLPGSSKNVLWMQLNNQKVDGWAKELKEEQEIIQHVLHIFRKCRRIVMQTRYVV
jgi:hypothetical protein